MARCDPRHISPQALGQLCQGKALPVVLGEDAHAGQGTEQAVKGSRMGLRGRGQVGGATGPKATNFSFEHDGWQFVGLDSTDGTKAKVAVRDDTLKWLDEAVTKLDKKKPLVLFTHIPLGPLVIYRATNADEVLERFKNYNLQAVFNGHFHASTERKVGNVILTTNRCCSFSRKNHDGSKEKGYFLCQAKEGKITREFVEYK